MRVQKETTDAFTLQLASKEVITSSIYNTFNNTNEHMYLQPICNRIFLMTSIIDIASFKAQVLFLNIFMIK